MKKKNKKIVVKNEEYYDTRKYKIFCDFLNIFGVLISVLALYVSLLVRQDTAELSKFSDKPIYYDISLYLNDHTGEAEVSDKYLSIDLTLIVDDFEVYKKNFLDVNYNSVFTKIKYFMVYDYSILDNKYMYMRYKLDDKSEAKMRFEDDYYVAPVKMNYSLTPNKKFCYILIYTETTSEENLDLIFFNYYDSEKTFKLDTITDDNGKEKIDIKRIDDDVYITRDYFTNLWSNNDEEKYDIDFMFSVYDDLVSKLKDRL